MNMSSNEYEQEFLRIIEASLEELRNMNLLGEIQDKNLEIYAVILESYLCSEQDKLEQTLLKLEVQHPLYVISNLRLENLKKDLQIETLSKVSTIVALENTYSGEAAFTLGRAYLRIFENEQAKKFFQKAYKCLEAQNAKKKAIKAFQNLIISETRINPKKKYIEQYEFLAQKAKEVSEFAVEAISYHNISKELMFYNANELALTYAHKAVKALSHERGSLHFFEAILNRAHAYIKLGKYDEAYEDYQLSLTSRHPQIMEAQDAIKLMLEDKNQEDNSFKHIEPSWRDKLKRHNHKVKIKPTKVESKLIDFIKSGPKSKVEIIDLLYGKESNWESSQNNLRVLLYRFRKKFPGLLVEENESLSLKETLDFI